MPEPTTESSRRFILVVDDEPDVLRYQGAILEDAGFEVATAGSAEEALEIVRRRVPDLISLDLVMPGKSGIRFLHSLRRNRAWSVIPVIIVTGHARDDVGRRDLGKIRDEGMISGPQVCLEKPVRPEDYAAAVRERLGIAASGAPSPGGATTTTRGEIDALLDQADIATRHAVLRLLRGETQNPDPEPAGRETLGTVLVVDDEPDVTATITVMLEDAGYVTEALNDPRAVIATARKLRPDLITLDLDMPMKSGLDVYRELKDHPTLAPVPVIVITGVEKDVESMVRERSDLPDFSGYLNKPIDREKLIEAVRNARA